MILILCTFMRHDRCWQMNNSNTAYLWMSFLFFSVSHFCYSRLSFAFVLIYCYLLNISSSYSSSIDNKNGTLISKKIKKKCHIFLWFIDMFSLCRVSSSFLSHTSFHLKIPTTCRKPQSRWNRRGRNNFENAVVCFR